MKFVKRFFIFLFIIIIVILTYLIFNGYVIYKEAMDEKSLDARIAELRTGENYTLYSDVPDYYLDAVVCIEDHRFFSHFGIDIIATLRALKNNLIAGEAKEGGSSITQQVAKNLCFTQEKTIYRKIAELFVVFDLERNYSKEDILEIYINDIYFGAGYYNIHDASKGYYNKLPSELTLYEATLLAGVPNAPSVYAPTNNLKLAEERQSQVLNSMVEFGKLSSEKASEVEALQTTK